MHEKYIEKVAQDGFEYIAIYSDGCGAQNKNRFLFTCYLYLLTTTNIKCIEHKYLEPGHTQNEGDNMHSVIEGVIDGVDIYTPNQYYALARSAKCDDNPYHVKEINQEDIIDWKAVGLHKALSLSWTSTDNLGEKVKWSKIMQVRSVKDHPYTIFFKYHHGDDDFRHVILKRWNRGRNTIQLANIPLQCPYDGPIALPLAKHKDLMQLKNTIIPAAYHHFYDALKAQGDENTNAEDEESDNSSSDSN